MSYFKEIDTLLQILQNQVEQLARIAEEPVFKRRVEQLELTLEPKPLTVVSDNSEGGGE